VSCKIRSAALLERVIPVTPPIVNNHNNPYTHAKFLSPEILREDNIYNQEKIFTPVGTLITIVAPVK